MIRVAVFCVLFGAVLCAPTTSKESTDDDSVTITADFFPEEFKVHTAEHDIVSILVPLNALNFDDDDDDEEDSEGDDDGTILFFVEADVKDGVKEYKGLSVLKNKVAKKLLETGTDAAAANDEAKTAHFAATDGIYVYNAKENTAEKYGTVNDNLIGIAKYNGTDAIYVLTANNEVYLVTEEGTKKEKLNQVVGAQQIVLDYSNNLYYYNAEKEVYVVVNDGVKKIEGLPSNPSYINLLKPPFIIENGIPVVINNQSYVAYVNGSSEVTDFTFDVKPSAFAIEGTILDYFAYNKSIYEYNVLAILMGNLIEDLHSFINDNANEIQAIATRSRSALAESA